MIFELLFQAVQVFIELILTIIPTVPPMPQAIVDATATIFDITQNVGGIVVEIYGQELFTAIMFVSIGIIQFDNIYHLVLWVIRKIPVSIH
jgi:hypothetical protein